MYEPVRERRIRVAGAGMHDDPGRFVDDDAVRIRVDEGESDRLGDEFAAAVEYGRERNLVAGLDRMTPTRAAWPDRASAASSRSPDSASEISILWCRTSVIGCGRFL